MKIINYRYKILENLSNNNIISSYKVEDIYEFNKIKQLNIINSEYMTDDILDVFISNFSSIAAFNSTNMLKIYDFDYITTQDNQKIENGQYFYTLEFIDKLSFFEVLNKIDDKQFVCLLTEIFKVLNYLNMQGVCYNSLTHNNINITLEQNQYIVKLNDFVSIFLNEMDSNSNIKTINYNLDSKNQTIEKFLQLLNELINAFKKERIYAKFENTVTLIYTEILKLDNEHKDFNNIINIINNISTGAYNLIDDNMGKINSYIKIIGRNEYINKLMINYNNFLNDTNYYNFITFHGESGIGKTKIIKEFTEIIKLKKYKFYSGFTLENEININNKLLPELLIQLIPDCDDEIIKEYEKYLIKIIPNVFKDKKITPVAMDLQADEDKFIYILSRFINKATKNKKTIMILDNIHFADKFFINLIKYYHENFKNIIFICTYCDMEITNENNFYEFIDYFKDKEYYNDVVLDGLNEENIGLVIKNLLNMPNIPINFTKLIYSKTMGNPRLTEEVIKWLYSNGELYLNIETGTWYCKDDYNQLDIPNSLDSAIKNIMQTITKENLYVLQCLSIFNKFVPFEYLKSIYNIRLDIFNELLNNGLIIKSFENKQYVYGFANKFLKKNIYDSLSNEEQIKYNDLVLKYYINSNKDYKDIIYYAIKSKNEDILYEYIIKASNIEYNLNNYNNVKDILELSQNYLNNNNYKLNINNKLISIYKDCNKINLIEPIIDKSITFIELCDGDNIIDFCMNALHKSFLLLLRDNERNSHLIHLCEKSLKLNNNDLNNIKYKISYISYFCLINKMPNYDLLNSNWKQFENIDNFINKLLNKYKNDIKMLNDIYELKMMMGFMFFFYSTFENSKKSIQYFRQYCEFHKQNGNLINVIRGLINTSGSYLDMNQIEDGLKYQKKALDLSLKIQHKNYIMSCYINMMSLYFNIQDYNNCYKIIELLSEYMEDKKNIYYAIYMNVKITAKISLLKLKNIDSEIKEMEETFELGEKRAKEDFYINSMAYYFIINDIKNAQNIFKISKKYLLENNRTLKYNCLYWIYIINNYLYNKKIINDKTLYYIEKIIKSNMTQLDKNSILEFLPLQIYFNSNKSDAMNAYEIIKRYYNDNKDFLTDSISNTFDFYENLFTGNIEKINNYLNLLENKGNMSNVIMILSLLIKENINNKYINYTYAFKIIKYFNNIKDNLNDECILSYFISDNNKSILKLVYKLCFNKNIEINSLNDINNILDIKQYEKLYKSESFLVNIRKHLLKSNNTKIESVFKNITNDSKKDILNILNFIKEYTLSDNIALYNKSYDLQYSIGENLDIDINLFEHAKIDITNSIINKNNKLEIYLPLYDKLSNDNTIISTPKYYIYLSSDNFWNNILLSLHELQNLFNLLITICEKDYFIKLASIDKLTGALTRRFLEEAILNNISLAQYNKNKFCILMFDIDNFKQVNDKFGHQTGDYVLSETAKVVLNNIRNDDIFGRYGGEEFIIILPKTELDTALTIAEDLREKIKAAKLLDNKRDVTVSLGVAEYPTFATWKNDLIECADQALYVSKETGRNKTTIWKPEFAVKKKSTNKLQGIITGNAIQDSKNVNYIIEFLDLIKMNNSIDEKINMYLNNIMNIFDCEFITIDYNHIQYTNKKEDSILTYNTSIINNVIKSKQGFYGIDWDNIVDTDNIISVWNSIIVIPIIKTNKVLGTLYISTLNNKKEYGFAEYNLASKICSILAGTL